MSKNIMINLLKEIELYPELASCFSKLNDEQKAKFLNAMRTMNRGMLFSSPIHGEYHSEKVTLFCVLLGVKLGCTERELDILIDAGMYHDFKRSSDNDDTFHGLASARFIERVIPRGKYNASELKVLKSIMDFHSADLKIHNYFLIAENHEVDSDMLERGNILANILRDADALDRCRFSRDSIAYLKPQYLNFKESHDFIKLSEEINQAYLGKMFTDQEALSNEHLHKNNSRCLHSIGKNIFRLNSVLEHGLLSYSRLCKLDSSFQRNFDGGNSDKWISVVPTNLSSNNSGAKKEFLQHGIVFMFDKTDLYYPDENVSSSYAKSYGLPYTKNEGYADEQYAFDYIPKEKIIGISLDKSFASKDLCELDHYVYDSFNYDLFERNVKSYLTRLNLLKNGQLPSEIAHLMEKYKNVCDKVDDKILSLQDKYADDLEKISNLINKYVGKKLSAYYRRLIGIPQDRKITMNDVVLYELSISNYDYEKIDADTVFYTLTPKQEIKRKETYL